MESSISNDRTLIEDQIVMAKCFLEHAKGCMERIQTMTSSKNITSLQLNHGLCQYISNKLNKVVSSATSLYCHILSSECNFLDKSAAFKELLSTASYAERFIHGFCEDVASQPTLLLIDGFEHFSKLAFHLELMRIIFSKAQRKERISIDIDIVESFENNIIKEKHSLDQEVMLKDVQSILMSQFGFNDKTRQIATHVVNFHLNSGQLVNSGLKIDSNNIVVGRPLGAGGFASVREIDWVGERLAKKKFNGSGSDNPFFEHEASIMARLSHPNIVPFFGYIKDKRECSIIMELMDRDLCHLMEDRWQDDRDFPFDILESIDTMLQIAEAIQYLHGKNHVHRDLKAQNILVKLMNIEGARVEFIQIKVADFGVSKPKEHTHTFSEQTMNIGTWRWMAPEVIKHDSNANTPKVGEELKYPFKSDVYSYGMVCYEILSGRLPFLDLQHVKLDKMKELIEVGRRPQIPSHCSQNVKEMIQRCWSFDPTKRPTFDEICLELMNTKWSLIFSSKQSDELPLYSRPFIRHDQAPLDGVPKDASLTAMSVGSTSMGDTKGWEFVKVKRHMFWDTLPVMKYEGGIGKTLVGPIEPPQPVCEIRRDPYLLPRNYEWCTCDLTDEETMNEVHDLLRHNYVEDDYSYFRFNYSIAFLQWALLPPGYFPSWHVGIRAKISKKLVAFITGTPAKVRVHETTIQMATIDFLCTHKEFRSKGLVPFLINEIKRRVQLEGVWQAAYTSGVILPTPFATCKYWHRPLNFKKLVEAEFTCLDMGMTMNRAIRFHRLPKETVTLGFRPMERRDVFAVTRLLQTNLVEFKVAPHYNEVDVECTFLPIDNVINSYVVEDPKTFEITDFASFTTLWSTIIENPKHSSLKAAFLYYYVAISTPLPQLLNDVIIMAKQKNYDVFNALDVMQNESFFKKLKFECGDGQLRYYLYNYHLQAPLSAREIGLLLL